MQQKQPFSTSLPDLLRYIRWALRFTWGTNPVMTTLLIGFGLIRSLMPAGLVLVSRGLINLIVEALNGTAGDFQGQLTLWLAIGFVVTLAEAVALLGSAYCSERLTDDLNLKIYSDIMRHSAELDLAYFERSETRDVVERARDSISIQFSMFLNSAIEVVNGGLQILSLLAILVVIDPLILVILLVAVPPYLWFMWGLARRRFQSEYRRTTRRRWTRYYVSKLTDWDSVTEVRLLDLAPYLIEKFRALMLEFREENRSFSLKRFWGGVGFVVAAAGMFYMVLARVVSNAIAGNVTIGDIAVFGGAIGRLSKVAESTVSASSQMIERALYINNLQKFYEAEPRQARSGQLTPWPIEGRVRLENVSFGYPGAEVPVLKDISFEIQPGETIALVGENGAGKTTLTKLIARIYDPTGGAIYLDETDMQDISLKHLQRHIGFVFQNYGRYEATAGENIAYGNLAELLNNPAGIAEIVRQTGSDELITTFPKGYDTRLGKEFGEYDPSGGQWQKIAIMRAFARQSRLLILDEPTSNLDVRAEYELFLNFRELAKGRTTILVSHRFSTVSMADRILVLNEGRIIEQGSHAELLAQNGYYANLYHLHEGKVVRV